MNETTVTRNQQIGFLGTGNMASAIISGMLADGWQPEMIVGCRRNKKKLAHLKKFGIVATTDINRLSECAIVFLAVKPWQIDDACKPLVAILKRDVIIVSLAAGISVDSLAMIFPDNPLLRAMPNTPVAVCQGVTGLYTNKAENQAIQMVMSIFDRLGMTLLLDDEEQMHAITALSGSGPAYYFYFLECMAKTAKELGIDSKKARLLVIRTMLGAGLLAEQSDDNFVELCNSVVSKGGTTEAALDVFKQLKLEKVIHSGVVAARDVSRILAKD